MSSSPHTCTREGSAICFSCLRKESCVDIDSESRALVLTPLWWPWPARPESRYTNKLRQLLLMLLTYLAPVTLDNDGWHGWTRLDNTLTHTCPLERHAWSLCLHQARVWATWQGVYCEPAWSPQPANQRPSWETRTNERRAQPSHNTALTALTLPSSCSTHEIILWSKIFDVEMKSSHIS